MYSAGTVVNYGVIDGRGGYGNGAGARLFGGGLVVNGPSGATGAVIRGGLYGIDFGNSGSLSNYGTLIGTLGDGIRLGYGGDVNNAAATALIAGGHNGVAISGSAGTVSNFGTIVGSQAYSDGIYLGDGGTVTNGASGSGEGFITAGYHGIAIVVAPGTVANFGTIVANHAVQDLNRSQTVFMQRGGLVINGAPGATGALIDGAAYSQGVYTGNFRQTYSATGTIVNYGTIAADILTGVVMASGGTIENFGTISAGGFGIYFSTGLIANAASGLIEGSDAVRVFGSPNGAIGSVTNLGTIVGSAGRGVYLMVGGTVTNGANGISTSLISGLSDGVLITGAAGTVSNYGTIADTGTSGGAVGLFGGGFVTNRATGLITGYRFGVYATGSSGPSSLANYGVIHSTGTGTNLDAVVFEAGGTITNYGTIWSAGAGNSTNGYGGVVLVQGAAGSVHNLGTILSTNRLNGIDFISVGGTIVNGATDATRALISGDPLGVYIGGELGVPTPGAVGNVTNYGTITGVYGGVVLVAGGGITNGASGATIGVIEAYQTGVSINGGTGAVTNYGTIASTNTTLTYSAVYVGSGGVVTNDGLIASGWVGIAFGTGSPGTVVNSGTIVSTANFITTSGFKGVGVILDDGGLVINGGGGAPGALIQGYEFGLYLGGHIGVPAAGAVSTLVNYGTIASIASGTLAAAAAELVAGGTITNHGIIESVDSDAVRIKGTVAGTVINFGTIHHTGMGTSGQAIYLGAGGLVTNYGLLSGAHPGSPVVGGTGGYPGVISARNQPVTIVNFGTITNPNNSNGINLLDGGLLVNGSGKATSATISAPHTALYIGGTAGVPSPGAVGTVINYGTIANTSSSNAAISLVSGGTALNLGLISSARTGIAFHNVAGAIDNFGTIVSTALTAFTAGAGAYLGAGGLIANEAGATITAQRNAISLTGTTSVAATVSNFGLLTGSIGVYIGLANTGANTIVNYGTIAGTGGIAVHLGAGDDELVVEAGSTLQGAVANVHPGDTFDLPFLPYSSAGTVTLQPGNVLEIVENGGTVDISLDPAQKLSFDSFTLSPSGNGSLVGVVQNGVIYAGTYTSGIVLSNPTTQNPAMVAAGAYVTNTTAAYNGDAVYGKSAAAWNFYNYGAIVAAGAASSGVELVAGGTVTNGSSSALIQGYANGVLIGGGAGTVNNYGTIVGTGTHAAGIRLVAGGTVANAPGAGIFGGYDGVAFDGIGTLVNYGTIASFGTYSDGVDLVAGGDVLNASGGLIQGDLNGIELDGTGTVINFGTIANTGTGSDGIFFYSVGGSVTNASTGLVTGAFSAVGMQGAGTVQNAGTLSGGLSGVGIRGGPGYVGNGGTITGASSEGIYLGSGGYVANAATSALVSGYFHGVFIRGGAGTVNNIGTIAGTSSQGTAVYLQSGSVVNGASGLTGALITGGYGLYIDGSVGTIINYGTISGTFYAGAALFGGGSITNGATDSAAALITGSDGVYIRSVGTLANFGTISATATYGASVYLADGGLVTNGASGSASGLITGASNAVAMFFGPGTVINFATIAATGAYGFGAVLSDGGTVSNYGTIVEVGTAGAGVRFGISGSLTNGQSGGAGGLIMAGGDAVYVIFGVGSVVNYGTIAASGFYASGINLQDGGSVGNAAGGLITGAFDGVHIDNVAGTVVNSGTIHAGGQSGVALLYGGIVQNGAVGEIAGAYHGIFVLRASGTVVNYGTIAGTGGYGTGAFLDQGGVVVNGAVDAATALISGYSNGVAVDLAAGTVTNYGTILRTGTSGGSGGVYLGAGGTVSNASSGLIAADYAAVIRYQPGTLTNSGTIAGGERGVVLGAGGTVTNLGAISGTTGEGVYFGSGGSVTNGATSAVGAVIGGLYAGVRIEHAAGTVSNYGTIAASATSADGVLLLYGGSVINQPTGLIEGGQSGIGISSGGTVTNYGTVVATGVYGGGVSLGAGGLVANFGTVDATGSDGAAVSLNYGGMVVNASGGLLTGANRGIDIGGTSIGAGSVTNYGTVVGGSDGVVLGSPGATVFNAGTISGPGRYGIFFTAGGEVTNTATGLIAGYKGVVAAYVAVTVDNSGTIAGTAAGGTGLSLYGGLLVNSAGGLITGGYAGAVIGGAVGTVVNAGIIADTGSGSLGLRLAAGGAVDNSGTIDGTSVGVFLDSATQVVNHGMIAGYTGVVMLGAGTAINYGAIHGTGTGYGGGLYMPGGGLAVNYGTIDAAGTSGIGVNFHNGGGTLVNGVLSGGAGSIGGGHYGVYLGGSGDTLTNAGTIVGGDASVLGRAPGASVVNAGVISATGTGGTGLYLAGGDVSNSGLISGAAAGLQIAPGTGQIAVFSTGNGSTTDGYADPHWIFTNSSNVSGQALVANNPGVDVFNGSPPWTPDTTASSWVVDNTAGSQSGAIR